MNRDRRPDAEELLARLQEEERRAKRGKLTIFFGAAPGVGKTYAMLDAAQAERDRDVVIGVVETHGRADTAALTNGLELLPRRTVDYHGMKVEEFDLDATLVRRPAIVLVDELAHTNVAGSRHAKRWQDVEELLDAGIDVYTTVNVQHIESLNDVVKQIAGVVVRETVPDSVIEQADEIRLVDLPPAELLERLKEGKVYVPEQARRATEGFFKKRNLTALRELALRQTAERVDEQMQSQKRAEGVGKVWPVGERILVCVSSSPASARLIRAGRRMATSLHAEWIAVHVETPAALRMSDGDRERVAQNLGLAERLGGETVRLNGESAAQELLFYARRRNVTKIVVGKPTPSRWRDLLHQSFFDEMVRAAPDIDIHVTTGEGEEASVASGPPTRSGGQTKWRDFAAAVLAILENAIKYTPRERPIEILARATPESFEVEVADRGPGVPAAERDQVFEKFYRVTREGSEGGAGLGLAICRGFVEAHGGHIWVEDREGGGSRFRFTLPVEGAPPGAAVREAA